jgi:hypothetical protein
LIKRTLLPLFVIACLVAGRLEAKLHIFLDERLRGSAQEKVLYKFIPLTGAQEVDLVYVSDFMKVANSAQAVLKLGESDRGIYIGADRWPGDAEITRLIKSPEWFTMLGKISFLVENDAPEYAALPRGLYSRGELWRKFAQLTGIDHAGIFSLHYLDTRPVELERGKWLRAVCTASASPADSARAAAPLQWGKSSVRLNFKDPKQLSYLGHHVCIEAAGGHTIAELRIARTDVAIDAEDGRFSVWNEAQPLRVTLSIRSQHHSTVASENFATEPQRTCGFLFSRRSDRVRQNSALQAWLRKISFTPAKELIAKHDLAIRASGAAYFRGTLQLFAGSIEVARTDVRFTQHSWLAETVYALSHPSEYQGLFLLLLGALLLLTGSVWFLARHILRWRARRLERDAMPQARQTSASVVMRAGHELRLTAAENPFGCELADFGGIVDISLSATHFTIRHGNGAGATWPAAQVSYRLPDGYEIRLKPLGEGEYLLEVFMLSGKDSLPTSVKPSQSLPNSLAACNIFTHSNASASAASTAMMREALPSFPAARNDLSALQKLCFSGDVTESSERAKIHDATCVKK